MDTTTDRSVLEGKLIPELQQIAQGLGIEGSQKLRKAGLIDAIVAKASDDGPPTTPASHETRVATTDRVSSDANGEVDDGAERVSTQERPSAPTHGDRPREERPGGDRPAGDRPSGDRPRDDRPRDDRGDGQGGDPTGVSGLRARTAVGPARSVGSARSRSAPRSC